MGHKHHHDPHYDRSYHDRHECRDRQRQLRMRNGKRDDSGNRARAGREQDQRRE